MIGNETPWTIGGMDPAYRLLSQVRHYSTVEEPPSSEQVAAVLHALADYTSMKQAVTWVPDNIGDTAHSICRWLHNYGDYLEPKRIADLKGEENSDGF